MASYSSEEPESGDFMVLTSTSGSETPVYVSEGPEGQLMQTSVNAEELPKEQLISLREEAILKMCGYCGREGDTSERDGTPLRPFRIVIVGEHGAGKSSFVNGVAAALSGDRWNEYAYTGDMGKGTPITCVNQRYVKCCNGHRERYKQVLLPTLIDVAGLSNENDDKVEELLRLLFYGHIQEDKALMAVFEFCKNNTVEKIREKYSQPYDNMRVDRIIYVASAKDELPKRLMGNVHRAARPSHHRTEGRAVPIYGVMTKKDKVDEYSAEYVEKKKGFMEGLGLNESRFLLCSNYCDDLDPRGDRKKSLRPDLDVPVIEFLQEVCNRALTVILENEQLPGTSSTAPPKPPEKPEEKQGVENVETEEQPLPPSSGGHPQQDFRSLYKDALLAGLVGLAALVMLYVAIPSRGHVDPSVMEACSKGHIKDTKVCQQESSPYAVFMQRVGQLVVAFLIAVVVFLYRYVSRNL